MNLNTSLTETTSKTMTNSENGLSRIKSSSLIPRRTCQKSLRTFSRSTKEKYPELLAAIVLTMTIQGTDFTANIRNELQKTEFRVLDAEIGNRVAYMRSLLRSNSVEGDENRKAWQEITQLGDEIISLMQAHYDNQK